MKEDRFKDVILILEKIARNIGEDEDDTIYQLNSEFDIRITEEQVLSLKTTLKSEWIWIWVLKPFKQKDYEVEKRNLYFINPLCPDSVDKYVKKQKVDGKYFIKYIKGVILSNVHDYIFECLFEEYGINYEDLTKRKWEGVITSKQFKAAEIQAARELIAFEIYHKVSK